MSWQRQSKKWRRMLGLATSVLALAGVVDAFAVEPYRLELSTVTLTTALHRPLRVAHLTDLHTHGFGRRERLVVERLATEHPDLIVITGDTVDGGSFAPARELLSRLHAPLGVFMVDGNWERWRPADDAERVLGATGVRRLVDGAARIDDDTWVVGFDDALAGTPDAARALAGVPADACVLALFHSPAYFDTIVPRLARYRCAVAFAGHTHGGQVRLPLLGALWLPPGSGDYVSGLYERAGVPMYVSRGIGTSILPVRFACPPELPLIRLIPPAGTERTSSPSGAWPSPKRTARAASRFRRAPGRRVGTPRDSPRPAPWYNP